MLAWALPAHAQAEPQRTGGGIHPVAGIFAGRYDPEGASPLELLGARLGLGFGELAQLSGFYWRGVSRDGNGEDEGASLLDDSSWGGELQFNLNSGFGITPYVVGGVARVTAHDTVGRYAATAGAGLSLPLGRVLFHVAARDHMFGVTGLRRDDEPDELIHNWLYSAGITLAFGSRRSRPGAVVATVAPPLPDTSVAAFELRQLRDSLAFARGLEPRPADAPWSDSLASPAGRNYQSSERLLVPIPTQGSITLRYGPEPSPSPVVVTPAPPGAPPADLSAAAAAAGAQPTEQWLRQFVAAEVAQQLAARPAGAAPLTQAQVDVMTQRVLDGVAAAIVPRLDAAQAQRMNALREDLRAALANQRADIVADLARYAGANPSPTQSPTLAPPPAAQPALPPAAQAPAALPEGQPVAVAQPAAAQPPAAQPAEADAAAQSMIEIRSAFARTAAAHGALLTAAETERGPAAVLGDGAFDSGSALLRDDARSAAAAIAVVLREYPGHRVYVQGHTDAVGNELNNQRLSELRAESVRALLVQEGLPSDRVFAIGYGQGRPVAPNDTARGRGLNRRVEVVLGEYAPMAP
jgi:outer membrane protein OmpA-like peptidoglycan-associated protein